MTKWLIDGSWCDRPEKVEVLSQTEKTVTIRTKDYGGQAYDRKKVNPDIFDTFDSAKAFLIERQEKKIESLRLNLVWENGKLGKLEGLKNPDEVTP